MKKFFTFIAAAAVAMTTMATDYSGVIEVKELNGDFTMHGNATVSTIQDGDSLSFLIRNLILIYPNSNDSLYIGHVHITNCKPFNIRGINAISYQPLFYATEGDSNYPNYWIYLGLPCRRHDFVALFDDTDLIFYFEASYFNDETKLKISFSTPGSNVPVIKGDINRDGIVTSSDVTELYNILFNQ